MKPQTYNFRDIYLATFLKTQNHNLHNITVDKSTRATFHFVLSEKLKEDIKVYFDGNALVEPKRYISEFRDLRTFVYNITQNMKGNAHGKNISSPADRT